jgi:TonB family protein
LVALVLHLGGAALALAHLKTDDGDDGLGAKGAEYAVEMASPKLPDDDLPPGPDTEAAQASQQQVEQKAEVKETELPQDKPTEAEDPDRVVSPNPVKKPKEDDPKVAAVQTEAAPEHEASEATSRQTLDEKAPDSDKPKAPNQGIGRDIQRLTEIWAKKLSAYFEQHKRYPADKNKSATVTVSFVLDRAGKVMSVGVQQSSGDAVFDDAAVAMVRRSDPVPAPPAGLTDDRLSFALDVNFNKRK